MKIENPQVHRESGADDGIRIRNLLPKEQPTLALSNPLTGRNLGLRLPVSPSEFESSPTENGGAAVYAFTFVQIPAPCGKARSRWFTLLSQQSPKASGVKL